MKKEKEAKEEPMSKKEVHKEKKKKRERKGKPQKKKYPTEPAKEVKKTIGERQKEYPSGQKEVDLGKRRRESRIKKSDILEVIPQEKKEEPIRPSTRVMAPFVEIDLGKAKVFLIIPKQSFGSAGESIPQKQLNYLVRLNNEEKTFQVDVAGREGYLEIAEKRIELEKPIQNFEIIFPQELGGRSYCYRHQDDFIYVFTGAGEDLGRMCYLYDKNGNIKPLPQKEVWVLLREDFELGIEPNVVEDTWIWESYRLMSVDLKNVSKLIIKNRDTGEEKIMHCESAFSVDGEGVFYDDFGEQSPIFTGNSIEIKAPMEKKEGWIVWIQNKQGYKIVSDNWSGEEPLKLKPDRDLLCECGEFQVDICELDGESVATLFFRYVPSLRLNYPKELIIPDFKKGHRIEKIEVSLPDPNWEVETPQRIKPALQGYQIDLPPEKDTLTFSIFKRDRPETRTNFRITIPRLKWRTSRRLDWVDKPLSLKREELALGEDFYLYVNTNSLIARYDVLAVLEAGGRRLQESEFARRGRIYYLLLNQFYDTIKENKNEIMLKIKILKDKKIIGENIPILYFPRLMLKLISQDVKNIKPVVKGSSGMRKGKGFSKEEILQAGIKIEDIKRLNIPYDKHRKSVHSQNVEALRSLIGGREDANRSN